MEELEYKIGTKNAPIIITLKEFKGRNLLDIRKYFLKNEKLTPTKKGISLNPFQFREIIHFFNSKNKEISDFFDEKDFASEQVEISLDTLVGRSFNIKFENNRKVLVLDETFDRKLEKYQKELLKNCLLSIYGALYDVIDDEDDIQLVLDVLNQKLNKIKW